MSLPADWVEYIFSKLKLRYGRDFDMRWEGLDLAVVKADWADELDGYERHPALIEHALNHLPDRPPHVGDFLRIAKGGPDIQPDLQRLDAPKPAARETRDRLIAALRPALAPRDRDPRQWARDLIKRHETRQHIATPTALAMARDALRLPTFTEETA